MTTVPSPSASRTEGLVPLAEGVYRRGDQLLTRSLLPGRRIYGERLVESRHGELREWSHRRSKLAAYYLLGGDPTLIGRDSRVLYLGAASGTTATHVADIAADGTVYCVEFSPRSFRDLVSNCEGRPNMHPVLGDATKPEEYQFLLSQVDMVYQDVAQKRQFQILADNMERFQARRGVLALKARSEDVSRNPEQIFQEARREALAAGYRVIDLRPLDPHEKDHAMMVVER